MKPIDDFIARYGRELDYYQQLARICREQCEIHIEQTGVRAIVTARAKQPGRLRVKLNKRNDTKSYANVDAIYDDIVDLAGVRIALYFPGDKEELDRIIKRLFDLKHVKVFPENQPQTNGPYGLGRFSGYHATHYRVRLKEDSLNELDKRYAQGHIEIQVASVLMHAWAEINHDLVYKPMSGDLSSIEQKMLESVNGLVMSGEVSLETLQQALKERVKQAQKPFSNHFELAAYLYDLAVQTSRGTGSEPQVGRVDILFAFLNKAGLNQPLQLQEMLGALEAATDTEAVSQRLVDAILSNKPELSDIYLKVKRDAGERNPYGIPSDIQASPNEKALGRFMKRWGILEGAMHSIGKKVGSDYTPRWNYGEMKRVAKQLLSDSSFRELEAVLRLRSEVVHSDKLIDDERLTVGATTIENILIDLKGSVNADVSRLIDEPLTKIT
jgi:ppGpp synthetase/RelA/SpoT-type nucleotidyltranferase